MGVFRRQMQCVLTFVIILVDVGISYMYPSIQWTHVNPLFKNNRTNCVYPQSKLFFVCPNTVTAVTRLRISHLSPQYENLWLVSKVGYEQCKVNKSVDRQLQLCDKPFELKSYGVIFRKYSPGDDPVFNAGEDYYFIATSDGTASSVNKIDGGHCKTHNMKLKFHICMNNTDPLCGNDDLCNGIDPTREPTAPTSTEIPAATIMTAQLAENTSSENYTTPTTGMTNKPGNADNEGNIEGNETAYLVTIGILVFLCVLLSLICVVLFYRFYNCRKPKSSISSNSSGSSHDCTDFEGGSLLGRVNSGLV